MAEMPILVIIILVVLIALGVGALVGSASTYLLGALIGVAIIVVPLAVLGAVAGRRHPSQRTDGAPLRRTPTDP